MSRRFSSASLAVSSANEMDTLGNGATSVIVTVAVDIPSVYVAGDDIDGDRVTTTVSSRSLTLSASAVTVMSFESSPSENSTKPPGPV